MEPLIIGLLQQMMNPPLIPLQGPQTLKMACHTPDHPGHPGHSLQNQTPLDPLRLGHLLDIVPGHEVVGASDVLD